MRKKNYLLLCSCTPKNEKTTSDTVIVFQKSRKSGKSENSQFSKITYRIEFNIKSWPSSLKHRLKVGVNLCLKWLGVPSNDWYWKPSQNSRKHQKITDNCETSNFPLRGPRILETEESASHHEKCMKSFAFVQLHAEKRKNNVRYRACLPEIMKFWKIWEFPIFENCMSDWVQHQILTSESETKLKS